MRSRRPHPDGLREAGSALIARKPGVVRVRCDRVSEWLAAIDVALRLRMGLAEDMDAALLRAVADGIPVGDLARGLLGRGGRVLPAA